MICKICGMSENDQKKFSNHLNGKHKISSIEYTIKFLYGGDRPQCPECGDETRYVSFQFKEYCKLHGKIKMSKAGAAGGKAPAWNRGLTKENDHRLLDYSKKVSGEKNHFWGKKHSEDTLKKIASTKRNTYEEIISRFEKYAPRVKLLSQYEEYENQNSQLRIKCIDCETESEVTLLNLSRCWMCRTCNLKQ